MNPLVPSTPNVFVAVPGILTLSATAPPAAVGIAVVAVGVGAMVLLAGLGWRISEKRQE